MGKSMQLGTTGEDVDSDDKYDQALINRNEDGSLSVRGTDHVTFPIPSTKKLTQTTLPHIFNTSLRWGIQVTSDSLIVKD